MLNSSKIAVFDIDGTLADTSARIHYLQQPKKDWSAFFREAKHDLPLVKIINILRLYDAAGYLIILCTGRPANLRNDTLDWLYLHNVPHDFLLMRLTSDRGPDYIVKLKTLEEFLPTIGRTVSDVEVVFEDRVKVAQMWESAGITTCLVGEEWKQLATLDKR